MSDEKKKTIILVLGNGYNCHFHLKMTYADFFQSLYDKNKDFWDEFENLRDCENARNLYEYIKKENPGFSIWDYFYFWDLVTSIPFYAQEVNIETLHYFSFEEGFWMRVAQEILNTPTKEEETFLNKFNLACSIDDDIEMKINLTKDDKKELCMIRKVKFIAKLIIDDIKDKPTLKSPDIIARFRTVYQGIYDEFTKFEKEFGMFLEDAENKDIEKIDQNILFSQIKEAICPNEDCDLKIINFNYNKIDNRVKYQCEYVHGDTKNPIFSGLWHNSTERDDPLDEKHRFTYMFDKLYRRRERNLKPYCEIIDKDNDNILAFYGCSFNLTDFGEYRILHNLCQENPIYLFYSDYTEDYSSLSVFLSEAYTYFYQLYYDFDETTKFYELMENGKIHLVEIPIIE